MRYLRYERSIARWPCDSLELVGRQAPEQLIASQSAFAMAQTVSITQTPCSDERKSTDWLVVFVHGSTNCRSFEPRRHQRPAQRLAAHDSLHQRQQ